MTSARRSTCTARHDAAVTLHLVEVPDPSRFGVVPTDESGRVTAFLEKTPDPVTNRINAGCYVFRREVIDQIPAGRRVSVERETFPALISSGQLVMGYPESAYWIDVGTPQTFVRGSCDLVLGRLPRSAVPGPAGPALLLAGPQVAPDASVTGGTVVGAGASVGAGATVCRQRAVRRRRGRRGRRGAGLDRRPRGRGRPRRGARRRA